MSVEEDLSSVAGEVSPKITSENGPPTRCDKCHSPYAVDPAKRKKCSGSKPKFRRRLDKVTNKILILCNKCGLSMSRVSKRPPKKPLPSQEDRVIYLAEAEAFALSLAERLKEPDAKRLYCPHFKTAPCGCLQKYLKGEHEEDLDKFDERANKLLELLKTAKQLSSEKIHSMQSVEDPDSRSQKEELMGRGVGNRHSKLFEDFVLSNRISLREELHLCERATQRVLMYSNNFLHKELKSMKNQRIERKTGKFVKGLLKSIPELAQLTCCNDNCIKMAVTHQNLLETWRQRAQGSQKEARTVLAEMLSPCDGCSKPSCYKFISLVTGCSMSTISSVNNHLKKTCGSKEPPEHGLKRWWREHPKRKKINPPDNNQAKSGNETSDDISSRGGAETTCSEHISEPNSSEQISHEVVLSPKVHEVQSQQQHLSQIEDKQQPHLLNEQVVHQSNHTSIMGTSSLPQTIHQLLLSPDIGAITILAASSKNFPEQVNSIAPSELEKEGLVFVESIGNTPGPNVDNMSHPVQYCQSSSANLHLTKTNTCMKDNKEAHGSCTLMKQDNDATVHSVHEMGSSSTEMSCQILPLLEIPLVESSSQTSVITSSTANSHQQSLSVISPSVLEPVPNMTICVPINTPCIPSVVILPETLMLGGSLVGNSNLVQSGDNRLV